MDDQMEPGVTNQIQEDLVRYYIQGHVQYDPDIYKQILHPDWKMFHLVNGELVQIDREEFCRWYAPELKEPGLNWEWEFLSLDVTGEAASVKLRLENQHVRYVDYLSLLRIAGKWWITHKIYHESSKK